MRTLNLGVLAHVDAGKTSLTERLLYAAGVIDEIGSVDDGTTKTDSLELERQRGITIKSAVVSFEIGETTVNLIDTPGHPDFIAEVERVLALLDGAVLVVSAVEGVQAQTRVLMRALQRLAIPTVFFVNKIDRRGARTAAVVDELSDRLGVTVFPLGNATHVGTRAASASAFAPGDDDYLPVAEIGRESRSGHVHPVLFGSAMTGTGVEQLMRLIPRLLPWSPGRADGPQSGTVFKVDRAPSGERVAYVRMYSGTIRVRDRIAVDGRQTQTVTGIRVFESGATRPAAALEAGGIALVSGLGGVRIGDVLGVPAPRQPVHHFAPPTLETAVVPARREQAMALGSALSQLADQDPLINLRQDDERHEFLLSLYGEVQKEVIETTLARDFGVEVEFRDTLTICIERVVGSGASVEFIKKRGNPFVATVGLRVDPGPVGSGVRFALEVELGSILLSFHKAVEETVFDALRQGLYGWEVSDCVVTMTHSGYWPRQSAMHATFDKSISSTAGDFRNLTPLVLMQAMKLAGTVVCEPIDRVELEIPPDCYGPLLPVLNHLRAIPIASTMRGRALVVEADLPAAAVHELRQRLPGLTRGEGVCEAAFERYEPVRGPAPMRRRSGRNPLDRREYLASFTRRTTGAEASS